MTAEEQKVLVLRHPEDQGNFVYWMAEVPSSEARRWRDRLAGGESFAPDIEHTFGDKLTLTQVMKKLQSRDFQVLDYPAGMGH
jgi:hypothetical protein